MNDDSVLRISGAITSKLLENGNVVIWTLSGHHALLAAGHFMYLSAFGTGATAREAAKRVGMPWRDELHVLVDYLCRLGVLSASDTATDATKDARNAASVEAFRAHARAWVSSSYDPSRADYFTFTRIAHSIRWIASLSAGAPQAVLDIGCGGGHLLCELARLGHSVWGIDAAQEMIDICNVHLREESVVVRERVSVRTDDITTCTFDRAFNFVTALGLIAWFDEPLQVFHRARSAVERGGHFIVDCANKLVTAEGVSWLMDAQLQHCNVFDLLIRTQGHPAVAQMAWLQPLAREYARLAEQLLALTDTSVTSKPVIHEVPQTSTMERCFSPRDIQMFASASGFEVVDMAGVGEVRTMWDHVLPADLVSIMNAPLRALGELPASLLWSTGFVVLLRAT